MSDRGSILHWRIDRALIGAWMFAILSWALLVFVLMTPWTLKTTARHFVAALGCDAARAVGLDEARPGEPGYWPWLAAEAGGTTCGFRAAPAARR